MPAETGYIAFGRHLRGLRERRGLTLTAAADASREIATDSSGRISQPYLSQVELGHARGISFPKLLTLSAIYLADTSAMIAKAPPDLKKRLERGAAAWLSDGHPLPPSRRSPPTTIRQVDQHVDEALSRLALNITIPLREQARATTAIREAIIPSAVAAYLHLRSAAQTRPFWETVTPPDPTWADWYRLVDEYRAWLLYDQQQGAAVTDLIQSIGYKFPADAPSIEAELVACGFYHRELARIYGHGLLPTLIVHAVRWRQTANLLYARRPRRCANLQPPPDPMDAALDSIDALVNVRLGLLTRVERARPADVCATIAQLADAIPALRGGKPLWDAALLNAVVKMLVTASNAETAKVDRGPAAHAP